MGEPTIHRLSEPTVRQIAAGEVISRPARVVAELVDNALDAGAERIDISVDGDGTERIRVADDGCGLSRMDAKLAVGRHTTSKLPADHDGSDGLASVSTLGFRGEALAAIADCGVLELLTNDGTPVGTRLRVENGHMSVSDAGRAQGTTVTVTDLFGERPARRESLATPATEFGQISGLVGRYCLARPEVRFSLTHNDTKTLASTGGDFHDALLGVYSADVARTATTVDHSSRLDSEAAADSTLSIRGILVYPSVTRSTRDHVRIAIDGRPVADSGLAQAVVDGYGSLIPASRYPIAALDIRPPVGAVDPNVHPAKKRVGLAGRDVLEKAVEATVSEALSTADARRAAAAATDLETPLSSVDRSDPFSETRVLGSFRALYVLCEDGDDLLVVDQHAAHERINYERLQVAVGDTDVPTAPLDPPESVSVSPAAAAAAQQHRELLSSLGFTIESFGGGTLRVSAVPAPLGRVADVEALQEALDRLIAGESPSDPRESLLAELACHPSLKAGDRLSNADAERLLDRLGECEQPFACPHGRPTICSIAESTLAAGFDRGTTRFG